MTTGPRHIEIVVPKGLVLRWHGQLRDRLARLFPDSSATLHVSDRETHWPASVGTLLTLEALLLRRGKPALSDALDAPLAKSAGAGIVIDLAGNVAPASGARVLRALYDGDASNTDVVAALMSGRAPTLALLDVGANTIVARGLPSLEAADGLTGGLEAVYSRMAALIEQTLVSPATTIIAEAAPEAYAQKSLGDFLLRDIAMRCARAIYHLCCHSPHWRVGWRFVDGPGLIDTGAHSPHWRVMQDREMSFAADPFPCEWRGMRGVFYEHLNYRSNKGDIFYQPFDENGPVGEPTLALEEPWHLSYPFLMEHGGELYMLPEASGSGSITLYRCAEFPGRWERVANLVDNIEAADATIFRHDGRYWMTSVVREGVGGYSDVLAIHYAADPLGPWQPHARRPALVDSRYARPAGAVVMRDGALLRPAQDCAEGYGFGVYVMRIDALTPERFEQSPLRRIGPGAGWAGKRLHTINRLGRLECIDGVVFAPKPLWLRRRVHETIDRRSRESAS